jgi:hypothetical protein
MQRKLFLHLVHQIQRELLWGDREGDRVIARVSLLRVAAIGGGVILDGEEYCARRLGFSVSCPSATGA